MRFSYKDKVILAFINTFNNIFKVFNIIYS